MLPRVVDALGGRADILVDGGIRSGQDVVKALALGAKGTLIGRPWVYAVAAQGQAGLENYLGTLKGEMRVSMALTGVTTTRDISGALLDRR